MMVHTKTGVATRYRRFRPERIKTVELAQSYLEYARARFADKPENKRATEFCMAVRVAFSNISDEWPITGPVDDVDVDKVLEEIQLGLPLFAEIDNPNSRLVYYQYSIESRRLALVTLVRDGVSAAHTVLDERLKRQPR